ncbi:hypothetical protein CV019_15120, partial [Staphylococcus haemolyticus]
VVAAIAGQGIGEIIADHRDIGRAGLRQFFEIVFHRKIDASISNVGAFAIIFDDPVAQIIDIENVVADAAIEHVGATSAVERVLPRPAVDDVAAGIAGQHIGPAQPVDRPQIVSGSGKDIHAIVADKIFRLWHVVEADSETRFH